MDASVQASLLEQLPDVDEEFLRTHAAELVASLGRLPGVDSVRAVVVRHIDQLVSDPEARNAPLQEAVKALRAYPDAVSEGDPLQLMTRHPAWVGLCHLELAHALDGDLEAALDVAITHASLGFSATVGHPVLGGDAAWAMAEVAEDAGWDRRAEKLLQRALDLPWSDEEGIQQVRLLLGQKWVTQSSEEASVLLEAVVAESSTHALRVQAAFVRSRIAEAQGEPTASRWLHTALESVHPDDDPSVRARLEAEIARLTP